MGFPLDFLRRGHGLNKSQHCPAGTLGPTSFQHPPFTLCVHAPCRVLAPSNEPFLSQRHHPEKRGIAHRYPESLKHRCNGLKAPHPPTPQRWSSGEDVPCL